MSPISARHGRLWLVSGVFAACAASLALGVSGPAYAAGPAAASRPAPSLTARASGRTVAGAVYGQSARATGGPAVGDFLKEHQSILAASHDAGTAPASAHGPAAAPKATQLHDWWGSFPATNSGPGAMATQSLSSTLRLSNPNDVLYAPTMTPANNSCIEVVTVHTTSTPQIWAWDWCNAIAPGAEVNVNSSFLADYTTTVNGRTAYTTKDVRTNTGSNTWTAYLWNYATGAWDTLFTSSGTDQSGLTYGWDMFEFYSTVGSSGQVAICNNLASSGVTIESSSLQILNSSGTWSLAGSTNSTWSPSANPNPSSYDCPNMKFNILANNYDWTVNVT